MKKLIVVLIALLLMPTSITLAAKGGNKPTNGNDLETRVQNLEDRLQNSDLDNDGFTPYEGDCNDADYDINPGVYEILDDNIDNNCDGLIDDCASAQEFCDGIDNNCDGQVDEGFNLGTGCSEGIGECRSTGVLVCSADGLSTECDATPGTPRTEICDGRDNDCDGNVDDNIQDRTTETCCDYRTDYFDCNCNPLLGCDTCSTTYCVQYYRQECIGGYFQNRCY
jgi:hypothetical protein